MAAKIGVNSIIGASISATAPYNFVGLPDVSLKSPLAEWINFDADKKEKDVICGSVSYL